MSSSKKLSEENQSKLIKPDRIEAILTHRSNVVNNDPKVTEAVKNFRKSLSKQKNSLKVKTEGFDRIGLKEMEEGVVYENKVLNLTSVDSAKMYENEEGSPFSIQILVQDEDDNLARAFIYNLVWHDTTVNDWGLGLTDEQVVQRTVGMGRKMTIVNPVLKVAKDGKLTLVLEDPAYLILDEVNLNIVGNFEMKMCRFCLSPPSYRNTRCSNCNRAFYCSKTCQINDWKVLKHNLICCVSPKKYKRDERNLQTVYELKQLCSDDLCPSLSRIQLREDYGFVNCNDINEEGKLIGLYQGLIKMVGVDLVKLHEACMSGTLADFISTSYGSHSSKWKGVYFEWFKTRKDVVRNRYTKTKEKRK